MLERPGLQVQKLPRHLVPVVTPGAHWERLVLLFLVFLLCARVVPVEPSLDLYPGARAWRLLQSLQELGLEIRK